MRSGRRCGVLPDPTRTRSTQRRLAAHSCDRSTAAAVGRLAVALMQAAYIVVVTAVAFNVSWGDPIAAGALIWERCALAAKITRAMS